jgi:hypothetical protein
MLRCWSIKNSFVSNIIPYSKNYLNENYLNKKIIFQTQKNKGNLFNIDKQIIKRFNDINIINDIRFNINITEQDHLYPKPYSLVSSNYIHSSLNILFKNNKIDEIYNIKFNYPDNYLIDLHYILILNDSIEMKLTYTGYPNEKIYNLLTHNKYAMNILKSFSNNLHIKT